MNPATKPAFWRTIFILAALEAGAAIVVLLLTPREGSGFSGARLVAIGFLVLSACLGGLLAWRAPRWSSATIHRIWIFTFAALSLLTAAGQFLLANLYPDRLPALQARLGVILWFSLAVSIQMFLALLIARYGLHTPDWEDTRRASGPVLLALGSLMLVVAVVALTGLGLTPDSAYWGEPGVPILGWQLALGLLGGVGVFVLPRSLNNSRRTDAVLALSLWILAAAIWLSVPLSVLQNSFYAPIRPPAFQAFPNSDAGYYDSMAESLLIGYPYQSEIPSRPLYVTLLAGLHGLVGENYPAIVVAQALILAGIPVLFFLLGRLLHGRVAGLIAALIATFREWTSLLVSSETRVSNSKMLLVDLPTLLMLVACALFTIRWFHRRRLRDAAVAGGMLGLLLLLRTQAAVVIPAIVLMALIVLGPRQRATYVHIAVAVGMVLFTIAPWLLRNYLSTGQISIDAAFQYRIIASQYRYTGNLDIENVDLEGKSVAGILWTFATRDPAFVLGFIANHFLATQIGGLLALPLVHDYAGLAAPIRLYWLDLPAMFSPLNVFLLLLYLAVIAIGLGAAWRRLHWTGLLPLIFSLAYSLGNGLARFSGWRYDLPADWSSYFYFALGAAAIIEWVGALFGRPPAPMLPDMVPSALTSTRRQRLVPIAALFALCGSLPWLAEGITSPRYGADPSSGLPARLVAVVGNSSPQATGERIQSFLDSPGSTVEIGRILYPRFFTRGNGLASAHPWPAYAPREYPRLGFLLLNTRRIDVIVPARQSPTGLTHAADAIVLGCLTDDHLEARLIYVFDTDSLYEVAELHSGCPLESK